MRALKWIALGPFAIVWDAVYRFRRFLYRHRMIKSLSTQVPVVSIGNLSFGGSGKTPFTIWLASWLSGHGFRPMVLSRGYRGALENKSGILKNGEPFKANPFEFGDEPVLIARRVPGVSVVVGKRRAQNLRHYFQEALPDVVILDDGFQHLRIQRHFNVVLFDALLPFERYTVAPLGYLREGPSALRDADAIVINRADEASGPHLARLEQWILRRTRAGIPIARTTYAPLGLFDAENRPVAAPDGMVGRSAILMSGLASPQSFYAMAKSIGLRIIDHVEFPDHHRFSLEDIQSVLARAQEHDAIVVTTGKDMVKIRRVVRNEKILYLEIDIAFISGQDRFLDELQKHCWGERRKT